MSNYAKALLTLLLSVLCLFAVAGLPVLACGETSLAPIREEQSVSAHRKGPASDRRAETPLPQDRHNGQHRPPPPSDGHPEPQPPPAGEPRADHGQEGHTPPSHRRAEIGPVPHTKPAETAAGAAWGIVVGIMFAVTAIILICKVVPREKRESRRKHTHSDDV